MAFTANAIVRMALFWFAGAILGQQALVPILGVCLFLPAIVLTPFVSWLIDNFNNRLIALAVQLVSALAFLMVVSVEEVEVSIYWLIPLSLLFSLAASYNKSYIYSLAKHNFNDVEPLIIKLNIVSTSMMVVSPALVAIPLMWDIIPFSSLFYFSGLCHLLFAFSIWNAKDGEKERLPLVNYFGLTYREVSHSIEMRYSFYIFLLCNFSFGAIAVSLPLLITHQYGSELGGELYSQVEMLGGALSIIVSRWFKKFEAYNVWISVAAIASLLACFIELSTLFLFGMAIAIFPYSVLQIVRTQVNFFKDTPKSLGAGLRGLLTMGQALSATLSCVVVYGLIELDANEFNLVFSAACVGGSLVLAMRLDRLMCSASEVAL
ncbi:hypothetical protein [Vibrio sp. SCSIO 43136]|uniref:hypothetical protein n=1 Tax=Vibrio sp. SCSIO 43136 TaxID=2819101 RepID=UPI002075A6B2|nr:hypothetical protein [Vibrio sp. SCSIO 43136]USD67463.1 hypothetical protein J4N39_22820 [Vibrio sp. SCSIO 43136]